MRIRIAAAAAALMPVGGATVLTDGRIVIGDDGPKELRVFGRSGVHLETWGGQGEGPGEFGRGQLWGMARAFGTEVVVSGATR